jgi:hypothetical protein
VNVPATIACALAGGFISLLCGEWFDYRKGRRPIEVDHFEWRGDDAQIWLKDKRVFRGSGTVWHRYPTGERASTFIEKQLLDVWVQEKWTRGGR